MPWAFHPRGSAGVGFCHFTNPPFFLLLPLIKRALSPLCRADEHQHGSPLLPTVSEVNGPPGFGMVDFWAQLRVAER